MIGIVAYNADKFSTLLPTTAVVAQFGDGRSSVMVTVIAQ
jgi:hypothetical protein